MLSPPCSRINGHTVAIRKLIEEPENAVHIDLLCDCQFAKCSVAGKQSLTPRFGYGEREGIENVVWRVKADLASMLRELEVTMAMPKVRPWEGSR